MRLSKVECGDVFQVSLTNGCGFVQCVKEAPKTECEIIRVLPGIYSETDFETIGNIIENKEVFFLQLPVKYAVKQNLLSLVGNFPVPSGSEAPRYYRTEHHIKTDFIGWHIVDSETLQIKLVKKLSPEEIKLSPWDVISIPDIVEYIETGWTLEQWV